MITKTLYTASEIEKALGVGNGYTQVLVKRGMLTPIYLPGRKRPKYSIKEAKRALNIN